MKKRIKRNLSILIIFLITFTAFCVWQNNDIVVTEYRYNHSKIPDGFNDYKILQISDLHGKRFGKDQSILIKYTKEISPDIIVITGDLIDRHNTNIDSCLEYIKEAVNIAPIYFVSGNHENWSGVYEELSYQLNEYGVTILNDQNIMLQKDEDSVNLIGMQDISFSQSNSDEFSLKLNHLVEENNFNILLSHRPELMNSYVESQVDLVFSGHAHGGQFRLPFVGGIIAPDQGLFPKYTSGIYETTNTTMVVSRGLGNSIIPIRIFNRPELVVLSLGNK